MPTISRSDGVRLLAPACDGMTAGRLAQAVRLAEVTLDSETTVGAREVAAALVYLHAKLQSEDVLVAGDTLRLSVALLRDLYDLPDHRSVPVRLLRGTLDADGHRVLVCESLGLEERGDG